jgi:hypothetical protein
MKGGPYHKQVVKRHYGGELRGLAHNQLFRQRGLFGVKLGPANRGRRLDAAERQASQKPKKNSLSVARQGNSKAGNGALSTESFGLQR